MVARFVRLNGTNESHHMTKVPTRCIMYEIRGAGRLFAVSSELSVTTDHGRYPCCAWKQRAPVIIGTLSIEGL